MNQQSQENLIRLRERKIGQARTLEWLIGVAERALKKEHKHISLITADLESDGAKPVSVQFMMNE